MIETKINIEANIFKYLWHRAQKEHRSINELVNEVLKTNMYDLTSEKQTS